MMQALKAEYRKLFTVRSTYIILLIVLVLLIFFGFFISGWRIDNSDLHNPGTLAGDVTGAVSTVSLFLGLLATLLMTHEYRYNTIMHTLTLSNSRSRTLLAKILILSGLAVIFTIVIAVLAPLLAVAGMNAHHLKLVPQTLHFGDLLWRCLLFGWGYTMTGLLLATLIRNQIGTILTLFIVPGTVEALAGLILKNNVVYLPFSALEAVIGNNRYSGSITNIHAAMVFMAYLIVGWIIAWTLFLRRDAN
jgi:ABC-type transport system involved in multi-copper enzyme maturation permease subunit